MDIQPTASQHTRKHSASTAGTSNGGGIKTNNSTYCKSKEQWH